MYCTSFAELYDVDYTVLRFGIPYGPRARPAAVVPQFVRKALAAEPITIAGSGDQSRRFVYVEDLAAGCVAGLSEVAANRFYNLVGAEDTTIIEIAEVVRDLVGDVDIVHTPSRPGDFRGARVSGERAARELGWSAETSFPDGVARYLAWHRATHDHAQPADPTVTQPARQ
jgi:UDP-glucose 4-epimerase